MPKRFTWNIRRTVLTVAAVGLTGLALGLWLANPWLAFLAGVLVLCIGGYFLGQRRTERAVASTHSFCSQVVHVVTSRRDRDPTDTNSLVEDMLDQGRYALLLRPQIAGNLSGEQRRRAQRAIEQEMAVIPGGELLLGMAGEDVARAADEGLDLNFLDREVFVDECLLDKHAVTNRQFYQFVEAGGYEEMAIWEPQIWPAVSSFVDQTGQRGPRYWKHGTYPAGLDDHPVVGISWFEAAAYARWVGKRLPTDAEWEKAASWPVHLPDSNRLQRRYPWGDSMQRTAVNIWGTGPGHTLPADDLPTGGSAAGLAQLAGNVWEWTLDDFAPPGLILPGAMKSVRGGAFDTYFENQATCQFKSGEISASRRHNIGFRCGLSGCDLRNEEQESGEREPNMRSTDHEPVEQEALSV